MIAIYEVVIDEDFSEEGTEGRGEVDQRGVECGLRQLFGRDVF